MPPFAWVMLCTEQNMLIIPPFQCRSFTNYRSNSNEVGSIVQPCFVSKMHLFFLSYEMTDRGWQVCVIYPFLFLSSHELFISMSLRAGTVNLKFLPTLRGQCPDAEYDGSFLVGIIGPSC